MLKIMVAAMFVAQLTLFQGSALAQPTEADLTIRPGDTIEWTTPSPHFLQVGGAAELTPLGDVDKILTFSPALTPDGDGAAVGSNGVNVKGIVKDDADKQGVATFVFTCGQHPGGMISLPFTIAPKERTVRILKIRAASGQQWFLDRDDGTSVKIDVP